MSVERMALLFHSYENTKYGLPRVCTPTRKLWLCVVTGIIPIVKLRWIQHGDLDDS